MSVCTHTAVCTHKCVYTHASSGSAYWGLLYPWKTFPENIYFLLCTRATQPHRIARQYFRCLEFVDNINHIRRIQIEFQTKFLTTLWAFEILKNISRIPYRVCQKSSTAVQFSNFGNVFITHEKYALYTIQKRNNKRGKLGDVVYIIHLETLPRIQ